MFFTKNFIISPDHGLMLINTIDRDSYLKDKISHFSIYKNYVSKCERLGLIQEILDMYNTDCNTATFDMTPISGFHLFNINDHKKSMLLYYDLIFILGTIILNVFDRPLNRLDHVEEGLNGPVSTATMFLTAYKELVVCKENDKIPYGANLIFATLLEHDLKTAVKISCSQDWLKKLDQEIKNGTVVLLPDESDLFSFLCYNFELSTTPCTVMFDSVVATTTAFYNLLTKYTVVGTLDKEAEKLLLNKYTLNPFLNSTICKSKIESPYLELVNLLFSVNDLNLRNNLAHCNYGYTNYQTINVAALLYSLATMISSNQCLK